ncbi:hypothetical protein HYX02_03250 [Candidatus Woesearchaeota archaeon]|nr:hypothetical protein [Candidatus Woesearchaeota archaeon]
MKPKPEHFIHYPEIPTPTVYIQYKGIMDMQDIYESIADFFRQKKFKFYETQQRLRRPSPFGAEIAHNFVARRKVEDYYEWIVNINMETFDMHDIEVVLKNGTKKKMTKGRIWVQLSGKVEMDYEKLWEKSSFLAQLKGFYNKYIVKKKIEGVWWDELYYKIVLRLHTLIKERLKMESEGFEARHMSGVH